MGDIASDLKPLTQAIARLGEGIARYEKDISDTQIRDGLVQRFEFTYEISHKTLKRYLEMASPTPDAFDDMPFQDLIRTANEQNLLLSDWPRWRKFREMRGKTSHTYDVKSGLLARAPRARPSLTRIWTWPLSPTSPCPWMYAANCGKTSRSPTCPGKWMWSTGLLPASHSARSSRAIGWCWYCRRTVRQ